MSGARAFPAAPRLDKLEFFHLGLFSSCFVSLAVEYLATSEVFLSLVSFVFKAAF